LLQLQSDAGVHVHWKGAAELVLSSCKSWLALDGSVQPMSAEKYNECKKSIEDMATSSLRCVAFAYCPCEIERIPKEDIADWKLPEDDLTLLCIVGIKVCGGYFGLAVCLREFDVLIWQK
jgi:Ca2+-transporting ATPase